MARKAGRRGAGAPGKGKALVPPPGTAPGKGKGKALVPPMKGAGAPPPRAMRGRVVTVPVLPIGPPPGRRMGPPPPGVGAPPRMTPPMAPAPPRAERLEPPPVGRAQTMAALRRGKVAF